MTYRIAPAGVLLVLVITTFACAGDEESISDAEDASPQAIEITLKDFYFTPGKLDLEPGSEVEVRLKNSGQAPHTFTIDSLNVDTELQSQAEDKVSFTVPDSGELVYYCRFHEAQEMRGTLRTGETARPAESPEPAETPYEYDDLGY